MPDVHPLLDAVAPLVERIDGRLVPADELEPDDVPLVWEGHTVGGVRLATAPSAAPEPGRDLEALIADVSRDLGAPLAELPRADKQRAVRVLEERGAFSYRKSAETIADALGVSRFTVYNYLNRSR